MSGVAVGLRVRGALSETRPVPQQLDLVEALVEEVLVVLDDLDAHRLAGVQVEALHRLREGRRAEVLLDLVPRSDERVDTDGEVLVLFEAGAPALVDHLELHGRQRDRLLFCKLVRVDVRV